jgi:hypothetical protein
MDTRHSIGATVEVNNRDIEFVKHTMIYNAYIGLIHFDKRPHHSIYPRPAPNPYFYILV